MSYYTPPKNENVWDIAPSAPAINA